MPDPIQSTPSVRLVPGDLAPFFKVPSTNNENFAFDTVAGRWNVLTFFGSAGSAEGAGLIAALLRHRALFDDDRACFFGVSADPADREMKRVEQMVPGIRYFWDFDRKVAALYGALDPDGKILVQSFVLDPMLRVVAVLRAGDPLAHADRLAAVLRAMPPASEFQGAPSIAPVLVVPRIFEPDFCRQLIALYNQHGGQDSGFMRDVGGKTVGLVDYGHKRRADYIIEDEKIRQACMVRIQRRLVPMIKRAFQFDVTRMERYIVACYDADVGGYFRPHRDNTTHGTAHRRFAVTVNLNAEAYEGGELRFPEFGTRLYKPPTGGAVVFSCSMLHEAMPVRSGVRYVFLPFLYDEEAARIRAANNPHLGPGVQRYATND